MFFPFDWLIALMLALLVSLALLAWRASMPRRLTDWRRSTVEDFASACERKDWNTVANINLLAQTDPELKRLLKEYNLREQGRVQQ